jgi:hypothetical protein
MDTLEAERWAQVMGALSPTPESSTSDPMAVKAWADPAERTYVEAALRRLGVDPRLASALVEGGDGESSR